MELSINPVSPEKQAIRDILEAFSVFEPVIKKTDLKNTNKIALIGLIPKYMKLMSDNEDKIKNVLTPEFLEHLKQLAV